MAKDSKKALVPKLRFPEFRDDPEWADAKLEELITTITPPAKLPSSNYRQIGKYPIVDQSQQAICGWTDDASAVIEDAWPLIVFGDHTCALKLIRQPFAQGADGIKIFKARTVVSTEYLFHALNHRPLVMEDYKRHFSILKERRVFYPGVVTGEQQKIADCLSSLEELIAAQGRKVEALKTYKRGLMQQLFPREGETLPRLRFPEFRDAPEWRNYQVGDLINTLTPPKRLATSSYGSFGSFPIVDQSPSPNCGWTDDEDALVRPDQPVVIFGDHTCTVKLMCQPFAQGADGIKILTPVPSVMGAFLFQALLVRPLTSNEYKRHFSDLREKVVAVPLRDTDEQERLISVLSSLDIQIAANVRKLESLKAHKIGLTQQLFPSPEEA